jgi:dinuclear metal center YbgI/SA1388 family protein
MSEPSAKSKKITVGNVCTVLESIAPPELAQSWDNVGLLAGDLNATVRRVLLCIDLTPQVVDEAIAARIDFVMAYHPPIFKPVPSLRVPSDGTDEAVFRCIHHGIAVYSMHTALDAAEGGTNDVLAGLCGLKHTTPIEFAQKPGERECKLVVFVPPAEVDQVADALFTAGAGHIGDYSHCSFRVPGEGTFRGDESTRPTIGKAGRFEHVEEIRLEVIVREADLPAVIAAMVAAHSYEEPAYDIYPLTPRPVRGIGRYGPLARPTTLERLARRLKKATEADCAQMVGDPEQKIERAVILVGAAGSLPFRVPLTERDVIVTGEIRHHDALTIRRRGCTAIALGHWISEHPTLSVLQQRIQSQLAGSRVTVSSADSDPFKRV